MSSYSMQRPNQELSAEEKEAKRELKKRLKRSVRRRKLEVRLQQAKTRKNKSLEEETRKALDRMDQESRSNGHDFGVGKVSDDPDRQGCGSVFFPAIEQIYHKLLQLVDSEENPSEKKSLQELKRIRNDESKTLLQNMTKGTQERVMFQNYAALRGYTRLKFNERAVLVADSLARVESLAKFSQSDVETSREQTVAGRLWEKLHQIRSLCSIGCGPGCDAVGVAVFLSKLKPRRNLERAVLFDWAMPDWSRIVHPLESLLLPLYIDSLETDSCNVLVDWSNEENEAARRLASDSRARSDQEISVDLFVTSYLLSETRERWHSFYDTLTDRAPAGTLFLFAEPTAWQLHTVIERCEKKMDFVWLDSSMHQPELQLLEGRVGPAVLLGIKRVESDTLPQKDCERFEASTR
uniref:Uncharacterized protein n=1 Tax=Phaeodactylum tricornutum TaxID=2850 RepID=A0A8J9S4A1_PHATR